MIPTHSVHLQFITSLRPLLYFFLKVSVVVCFSCLPLLVRLYWMSHLVKSTVDQNWDLEIFLFFFDVAYWISDESDSGRKLHSETMSASRPCVLLYFCLWKYTKCNVRPAKWENGSHKHQTLFSFISECHYDYISFPPYCTNLFLKKKTNKENGVSENCKMSGWTIFSLAPLLSLVHRLSSYCSDTCRPGMHGKAWPLESLAL